MPRGGRRVPGQGKRIGRPSGSKNKRATAERRETYSLSLPPSLVERVDAITPAEASRSDMMVKALELLLAN